MLKSTWITLIVCMIVAVGGLIFIIVCSQNQERAIVNDITCEELRECILLDYICIQEHIDNRFLTFEWDFTNKVSRVEQVEIYYNKCKNNALATNSAVEVKN
jgi:hypothetical protein